MTARMWSSLVLCCSLSVSGCGYAVRLEGASALFAREEFEEVNLADLIDPQRKRADYKAYDQRRKDHKDEIKDSDADQKQDPKKERLEIEMAFRAFFDKHTTNTEEGRLDRNYIQERIIAASRQRCNEYLTKIKGGQSWSRFGLGAFTTMVAGASAVLSGGAASALAALGAASSGSRAEMDAQLFAEKTVEVIGGGIEKRRERLYKGIQENQVKPLAEYNLPAAVGAAVDYHGACTLGAGLAEIGESIALTRDTGAKRLAETLGLTEADLLGPLKSAALEKQLEKLKTLKDRGLIDETTLKAQQEREITNYLGSQAGKLKMPVEKPK